MPETASCLLLKGVVQHYAWGGVEFIPRLLHQPNPQQKPFAELWLGDHHKGVSQLWSDGKWTGLDQAIARNPEETLGTEVLSEFGPHLPYLLKILDVRQMLSIQAHPSRVKAEAGFKRENEAGIPLDAPHRVYKDHNHKPEVMVALTDFWLLHGFRTAEAIGRQLEDTPEFEFLRRPFQQSRKDLHSFYRYLMEMPQEQVDRILLPLKERLQTAGPADKSTPDFWAARAFEQFHPAEGSCDRGIFSIYLLNIVFIAPGQGIYQGAGIPHAYLQGVNVELMANSDNVFRGGLTVKHIDVKELMDNLLFEPVTPQILVGEVIHNGLKVYKTPAPDFELSQLTILRWESHRFYAESPHILIVLQGKVLANQEHTFASGAAFFVPAGHHYELSAEADAVIFRASLPE